LGSAAVIPDFQQPLIGSGAISVKRFGHNDYYHGYLDGKSENRIRDIIIGQKTGCAPTCQKTART
jgi:hypothetical protein